MQKFKSRSFSPKVQHLLDTKYNYYNPFASNKGIKSYAGWDPLNVPNTTTMSVKEIGTFNDSYTKLFKYWKPLFLANLNKEMTSYRLLWTTSLTLHVVGLKIFSLVQENTEDFMHVIGECLVGKMVYLTSGDMEDKAQFDSDYNDRDKGSIKDLQTVAYRMEHFSFYEYRYFCSLIGNFYRKRVDKLSCGYLLETTELASLCFENKNESIGKNCYGTEWNFFHLRKRAILNTYLYIDECVSEYPLDVEEEKPVTSSPDFSDDESDCRFPTMHKSRLKVMLFVLLFSGFECTSKCPCSKAYRDLIFLYGCPLPDDPCKDQNFKDLGALMQHFDSKYCIFHTIISKYMMNLTEISGVGHIPKKRRNKRSRK